MNVRFTDIINSPFLFSLSMCSIFFLYGFIFTCVKKATCISDSQKGSNLYPTADKHGNFHTMNWKGKMFSMMDQTTLKKNIIFDLFIIYVEIITVFVCYWQTFLVKAVAALWCVGCYTNQAKGSRVTTTNGDKMQQNTQAASRRCSCFEKISF